MSNPYDIYDTGAARHGRIANFIESPATLVGWGLTDMLAVPMLASEKGLQGAMGANQWKMFKNAARASFGEGGVRNLALHGRAHDFLRGGITPHTASTLSTSGSARSMMGRSANTMRTMTAQFGGKAAQRIGVSRLLHGASRGLFAYSMVQLGIGLMRGVNDMIEAYTPPEPKVPWHRDLETGGSFVDTRSAQTQRQRAIQAIHNTQLSTRAALGNEASFLHAQHR